MLNWNCCCMDCRIHVCTALYELHISRNKAALNVLVSCMPISSQWDPTVAFTCVNQISLFTAALATDVITDGEMVITWICLDKANRSILCAGLILLLPIYNVWHLQMPTHRKVAVIFIFLLGGLVTITGIIRLHFLTLAYNSLEDHLFNDISCEYLSIGYKPGVHY